MFEQQDLFSSNVRGPSRWEGPDGIDIWSVLDPQLIAESVMNPDESGLRVEEGKSIASDHEGTSISTFSAAQYDPTEPSYSPSSPRTNAYTLPDWHRDIASVRGGHGIPPESSGFWPWLCADIKGLARDLSESGLANRKTNTHPTSTPIPTPTPTTTTLMFTATATAQRIRLRPPTSSLRLRQDVTGIPLSQNAADCGNEHGPSTIPGFFDSFDNATRSPSSEKDMYEACSSARSPSTEDATLSTRAEDLEMSDDTETESWEYASWYGFSDSSSPPPSR